MTNTFITPVITEASRLGVERFEETEAVVLLPGSSSEEIEAVIRAVYKQVLGNAYVMESERLIVPESQLKNGEISVREFVGQVAKSELYRSRFFDSCPRYRAIELNFKHLLGRAPENYEEMAAHSQILDQGGFEAEINFYIDSDEYQEAFGEYTVPFYRGYKTMTGKSMVGFTHLFPLLRGASSSDKNNVFGNPSRLNRSIITNTPSAVIPPSSVGTYGGLTDINKLLAEVLKPKIQPQAESPAQAYQSDMAQTEAYQSLKGKCEEQAQLIETLQKQLADLRSLGSIGEAHINKWQSYTPSAGVGSSWTSSSVQPSYGTSHGQSESYQDLQQRSEEQEKAIASLQQQLSQLRSLATIGEARLNKWRNRTFF